MLQRLAQPFGILSQNFGGPDLGRGPVEVSLGRLFEKLQRLFDGARLTAAGRLYEKHIGMARVLAVQLLRQAPGTGFIARFQQGPGAFQLVVETHRRLRASSNASAIIRSCCDGSTQRAWPDGGNK